jgi:peptide/nickel transport system permease protein
VLPAITLGYYATPAFSVLTARACWRCWPPTISAPPAPRDCGTMTVLFKHALRNAIIPVVAVSAMQFGFMLGGSIVV